ncbi:MAG: hypothetical protein ABI440_09350 [Casimicrobiaceae bacterium]
MTGRRLLAHALLATIAAACAIAADATPPSREEVVQWCTDASDTAQCNRLIEAQQLKRLPGLAVRRGNALKISLFPTGAVTFTDTEDLQGGTSYSLWDNFSPIDAVVVAVTREDRTTYVLLMRGNGRKFDLPAEPVLAPDSRHLVTADFCVRECGNEVALWQVARDGVGESAAWKPAPSWSDAAITWQDADTLSIVYTAMGETQDRVQQRKLGDPVFRPRAARR